ncbi:hypothetical protein PREVCOP_06093 [Segatella copri DSM 18205]|uniref:Uncharacterized protein n=1 Tax=Segatella copri DSM 18205 TaxID=537011 RepID=D1PFT5_9BACT|nr:hypothetical protein PREVCOP_06093 [Segatella copri DSM 18205]
MSVNLLYYEGLSGSSLQKRMLVFSNRMARNHYAPFPKTN